MRKVAVGRTYADLGRLHSDSGNLAAARLAFNQAAEIVNGCAANVTDDNLRTTFLTSQAVREVFAGTGNL